MKLIATKAVLVYINHQFNIMSNKLTTETFIERARKVHGDRYDYSKVEYANSKTKVCIICSEHGEFWQDPRLHLSGSNCPICTGKKKMTTEQFINEAKKVHGRKYDYSLTRFQGRESYIDIICPEHGTFSQRASNHLNGHGCPICGIINCASHQKQWTKETCYSEAKKYNDVKSFYNECKSAYVIAVRNGWLDEYVWLSRKKNPNGFWTKERVMREAKKYSERKLFRKMCPSAYNSACKNGWLDEFDWFPIPKNRKKWNKETCYEEAKKYTSKKEFRLNSITAYCIARDNGWLSDYTWFVNPKFVWNYEECEKEARQYESYNDFRYKSPQAYYAARKRGWLRVYNWLVKEPIEVWNKKWTYETCYEEAKKYKNRGTFAKRGKGAYDVARRNGWLEDYTWFPDLTDSDTKVDSVYRYFFKEQNAIYVGRTLMYRQHLRDIEHCSMERDTIYKFSKKHKCEIPEMEILEDNLTIKEGRIKEDYWRQYYESLGFDILNKGTTGEKSGSIGSLGRGKWTFEKAYEIARNFESVNEMTEQYEYLYKISKVRGWLDQFYWFRGAEIKIEKQTIWTEEVCREKALKYKTRKEFRAQCRGAYDKAKECGWLESYTWLLYNKRDWNYDSCKEEAKKYKNRNEFGKHSYGAYTYSRKHGWLDEFYPVPLRRILDYDTCKKLAGQYKTIGELLDKDRSLYNTLLKKKWLYDFFPRQD